MGQRPQGVRTEVEDGQENMETRQKELAARVEGVVMRACTSGGGDDEVDPKKGVAKGMSVERQEGERVSGARWTMDPTATVWHSLECGTWGAWGPGRQRDAMTATRSRAKKKRMTWTAGKRRTEGQGTTAQGRWRWI